MFGNNPKRYSIFGDGTVLQVKKIFKTIQGEGPYTGMPSIFLRLGGCNLNCNFCDTEFEDFQDMQTDKIISQINKLSGHNNYKTHHLVVITGGEPFRQPIELLCDKLISLNYKVQIETNGTLFRPVNEKVTIICSPKNNGSGYKKIREDLLKRINALKFLISHDNIKYNNVYEVGQKEYNIPVYVQPMDNYCKEKNFLNLELSKNIAHEKGYYLSLQTHKYANFE
jgi:organic radical activating enzyme